MAAIDALAFWCRRQTVFWMLTLPIAGLAAMIAYLLETRVELGAWREHWAWDFLFAVIYAMFLDRWMKETLLDGALPSDEADDMRRSTIAARFLTFAVVLCLLAIATAPSPYAELNIVACAGAASVFVLVLPSLAANKPLSFYEAFMIGRPLQAHLFLLVGGAMVVSLGAGLGLDWLGRYLPHKPPVLAALAASQRLLDCLLLAGVGYGLATLFRRLTDWQQPDPSDHPLPGTRMRARNA
jgi:hypothetical protein